MESELQAPFQLSDFDTKKRAYFTAFATSHLNSFRPHYQQGEVLAGHKASNVEGGVWRNVSEHCLVAGVVADMLAEELKLGDEDRELVVRAALVHDWYKKHEKLALDQLRTGGTSRSSSSKH